MIGIAAIPVLTRLYSPDDFGVLSVFSALIMILAPIITLRYVLAIPLPRHNGIAFNLLVLSFGLMVFVCIFVSVLLCFFGAQLLAPFSMQVLAPFWWLITLGLLATSGYEILTFWAMRRRDYRTIARTNIWQSFSGSLIKIILGLLALKPLGLLIGGVAEKGGGISVLLRRFFIEFKDNWKHLRWSRVRKVAWRHRGFPIYRVPSQFMLITATQSPLLFIAWQYNAEITGQFGLAMMALTLPLNLIGSSMGGR
ncbi:lipopolysaccharide biosynthesis protein [Alloalcanivorax xenomutans]|uniref:lipopolysaccharide biosynthesis protein n=1 Tax=Alloalcanivorax xenomutans TaxID=1094342 RepID=UPI0009B61326|nr:oligosaccharide flippase family protein [Alloalcanivorax xenomutans]ARB45398.1 hypothetical protein P40_08110 [Alloalcanivorax xenomutans]